MEQYAHSDKIIFILIRIFRHSEIKQSAKAFDGNLILLKYAQGNWEHILEFGVKKKQ